eukprot:15137275-Alexandrium_andersonii.AAC.1
MPKADKRGAEPFGAALRCRGRGAGGLPMRMLRSRRCFPTQLSRSQPEPACDRVPRRLRSG